MPPEVVAAKWQRALPAFRNEPCPIPRSLGNWRFPRSASSSWERGRRRPQSNIREALRAGHIDPGSLLNVSLARNQEAMRTSAPHLGFSPDLVWLWASLPLSPLAISSNSVGLMTLTTRARQSILDDWDRGYCPCCGSWPVLIESVEWCRALRCSFCASAWNAADRRVRVLRKRWQELS